MFTAYFMNFCDSSYPSYTRSNKAIEKTNEITTRFLNINKALFLSFLVILLSSLLTSCSTKYPDTQHPVSSNGNYRSVSSTKQGKIRGERRPLANSRQASSPYRASREINSEIKSTTEVSKDNPTNSQPRKVINISSLNNWLFEASEQGDVAALWGLLGQGADIKASNTNGETALHSAAAHNQVEAASLLIERGADVNALTILGWSPLHSAARFGSSDVVTVLLQSGVNVNHRNTAGRTALSLAQQAQQADIIRMLQSK